MRGKQCPNCPIKPIGGMWKPDILIALCDGPLRTSEIEHRIPEANPRVLARQLRSLEKDGIVQRKIYAEVPQRVEYSLTEYGKTMMTLLKAIGRATREQREALKNAAPASATR